MCNIRNLNQKVTAYVEASPSHFQGLINGLIEIICEAEPQMEADIKWNRITFTRNGDWHHWICGIERSKKYVSFVFHEGALLEDESRILQGTGQYVRHFRMTSPAEIPRKELVDLIKQAVLKQTDMLGDDQRKGHL